MTNRVRVVIDTNLVLSALVFGGVLALALVGEADYLVTGDRDLLCLVDLFPCPIVTASQFFLMNALS